MAREMYLGGVSEGYTPWLFQVWNGHPALHCYLVSQFAEEPEHEAGKVLFKLSASQLSTVIAAIRAGEIRHDPSQCAVQDLEAFDHALRWLEFAEKRIVFYAAQV